MTTPQYLEMSKKVIVKLGWNPNRTYVYSFLWWGKRFSAWRRRGI